MVESKLPKSLLLLLMLLMAFLSGIGCEPRQNTDIWTLPCLPRPIAIQTVLITSAGQSTDAYIVRDIANQLMIHNIFMPQTQEISLEDIKTLVIVVGYSPTGMKSRGINLKEEEKRIVKLLRESKKNNLTVITVYLGGKCRRSPQTDRLLELIFPHTHYLIGLREANFDNFFTELAKNYNIPLTLVKDLNDIREPFASAFR